MVEPDLKYNVICLSNQLWDFPNWTNKRHVMSRLAKAGHNVVFVDPPINIGNVFLTQLKKGLWSLARIFSQIKKDPESGAYIFTPLNPMPFSQIMARVHVARIKLLTARCFDKNRKTILWVYHVQAASLKTYIENLNYDLLVYDCVDNYTAFPEVKGFYRAVTGVSGTKEQEAYLAKKADVIFASAPGLLDKLRAYNTNVYFTPNVGDYEKFKDVDKLKDKIPADLKALSRPIIGFTGALDDYKFDMQLFKKIAADHPKYTFALIGQFALKDKDASVSSLGLDKYPNVNFMGFKDFKTIEYYFAGFDAFIIPYQLNDYTVGGCFPVKFHDALAAGIPTVVTDLPAYAPFRDVCYIAKTYQEFSDKLTLALEENNAAKIKARKDVAKSNNWEGKVATMLKYIELAFKPISLQNNL